MVARCVVKAVVQVLAAKLVAVTVFPNNIPATGTQVRGLRVQDSGDAMESPKIPRPALKDNTIASLVPKLMAKCRLRFGYVN